MLLTSWLRKLKLVGRPGPIARTRRQQRSPSMRFRPHLEALEDRTVPSTFNVTTTLDVVDGGDGDANGDSFTFSTNDGCNVSGPLVKGNVEFEISK